MKKRIVLVLLFLGCLSISWTVVDASEKQTYESNSGIGFYGKYEYPETETEVVTPNQILPAGRPSPSVSNHGSLPQTGTTNTGYLNLIGMLILSGSLLLILLNKNKKQEEIYRKFSDNSITCIGSRRRLHKNLSKWWNG